MTIDFIVHPSFGNELLSEKIGNDFWDYSIQISKILAKSKKPVIIKPRGTSVYFSKECAVLDSMLVDFEENETVNNVVGEIHPSSWAAFTRLVDSDSEFRVHGAYFGQCVQGFAEQLFGYVARGEHWYSSEEHYEEDAWEIKNEVFQHEYDGAFARSRIRLGVVIGPPKDMPVQVMNPRRLLRYGDSAYQLMDKDTKIYCPQNIQFVVEKADETKEASK